MAPMKRTLSALLGVMALSLAACGGGATPSASVASSPSVAAAKPSAAASSAAAAPASAKPSGPVSAAPGAVVQSAAGGQAQAAGQADKIVVSYGELVPQTMPVWYAQETGIFQQNRIDADLRLIVSTAEIAALIAGETQISSAGGPVVLNAIGGGADLEVTAAIAAISPFTLYAPQSIKTIQDLKGKAVGVSRFGSPSDIAMRLAFRQNNLDPDKDVRFVETGSTQARTAAMIQGTIQGGMANPLEADALDKAGLHGIYDLGKAKVPSAQSVVVARRDFVSSHHDLMQRYVDSIVQSMAKLRQDKSGSLAVLKKYFKSDDDALFGKIYDYYTTDGIWPAVPTPTAEMFADAKEVIGKDNDKIRTLDINTILDTSFVKSAQDRGLAGK